MLAFIDSCAGLIPCKLLAADRELIRVQVTGDRGPVGYRRGAIVELSHHWVVPRDAAYRSRQACGQWRIRPYSWGKVLFEGVLQ